MDKNTYQHWSETKYLKDLVTNPLIEVGDYSYFSGYYDHQNFEDGCVFDIIGAMMPHAPYLIHRLNLVGNWTA
ncbi:hypothetical protein [Latilactobacillus sakei]|uniref:hypothetical protein n=1 Tax=Latilactobacillus sakei TaxID=1599 RepID=UPI000A5BB7B6|nr:hypothetical protein [Latilactobacillus sakei]